MKTKLIVLAMLFLAFTFACEENDNQAVIYGIETAAVAVGYYAAQSPDVDMALRNVYDLSTQGKLTPEGVNAILSRLDRSEPFEMLLIRRILRLAELVGAQVVEGNIVDVAGIPPEFVNAIARGYVEGYDTFMLMKVKRP
jgi:hypothetical protein